MYAAVSLRFRKEYSSVLSAVRNIANPNLGSLTGQELNVSDLKST